MLPEFMATTSTSPDAMSVEVADPFLTVPETVGITLAATVAAAAVK